MHRIQNMVYCANDKPKLIKSVFPAKPLISMQKFVNYL